MTKRGHILVSYDGIREMPPKNENKKKSGSTGAKPQASKGNPQKNAPAPILKSDRVAMSFSGTANMNSSSVGMGIQPTVWVSKNAMIRCGLTYEDIVIIQTERNNSRVFCSTLCFAPLV